MPTTPKPYYDTWTGNEVTPMIYGSGTKQQDAGALSPQDAMVQLERQQQQALAAAESALVESRAATQDVYNQVMAMPDVSEGFDQLIGEYQQTTEEAVNRMIFGVEKQAEYMQMQVQAAARTGRLGANTFAIMRESSRMTGQALGETFRVIGEFQMQAAGQVAGLRVREQELLQDDRHARIQVLANLAGIEAQSAFAYAGIVAGLSRDYGNMLANMASLSSNLQIAQINAATAQKQINAQLRMARMDENLKRELAAMDAEQEAQRQAAAQGMLADVLAEEAAAPPVVADVAEPPPLGLTTGIFS